MGILRIEGISEVLRVFPAEQGFTAATTKAAAHETGDSLNSRLTQDQDVVGWHKRVSRDMGK